jgi:hypothetical protein
VRGLTTLRVDHENGRVLLLGEDMEVAIVAYLKALFYISIEETRNSKNILLSGRAHRVRCKLGTVP